MGALFQRRGGAKRGRGCQQGGAFSAGGGGGGRRQQATLHQCRVLVLTDLD